MALTDDAKKEIAEAIRIVREDRFEKHARSTLGRFAPPKDEPKEDEIIAKDDKSKVDPPPEKEPKDTPKDEPKKTSMWWGEIEQ